MSILDWLGLGSDKPTDKRIHSLVKTLTHKYVDPAKRWGAAEQLASWRTPESLYGLLMRFTVSAPSATIDDDEKKAVRDLLVSMGRTAVGPILKFMRDRDEVGWPINALDRILPDREVVGSLLEVLSEIEVAFSREPSKKVELLNRLKGVLDDRIPPVVSRFLDDTSDEVVIAALDILSEDATEELRGTLWDTLQDEHDRPRVQLKILELFAHKGWKVKGGDKAELKRNLPEGFFLTKKGFIKRGPEI